MKINLSKNSWHYRVHTHSYFYRNSHEVIPDYNFCEYVKFTTKRVIFPVIIAALTCLLLVSSIFVVLYESSGLSFGGSWLDFIIICCGSGSILLLFGIIVVGAIFLGICAIAACLMKINDIAEDRANIKAIYLSIKDRYCPIINWRDDNA